MQHITCTFAEPSAEAPAGARNRLGASRHALAHSTNASLRSRAPPLTFACRLPPLLTFACRLVRAAAQVDWEEFWSVIGEWMETGFNRLEELKARESQLKEERERVLAEEEARRLAAEKAAEEAAAAEEARVAAEAARKAELAAMSEADRKAAEAADAEEKKKAEDAKRRAELEAKKAEEAAAKAAAEAAEAAAEEERKKKAKAEREAAEAAEAAAKAAGDEEAARLAAMNAEEAAKHAADLERWGPAVQRVVDAATALLADPSAADVMEAIAAKALEELSEGEPGLGDAGGVFVMSDGGAKGALRVLAATEGRTPGGVKAATDEADFPEKAADVVAAVHSMIGGGERLADVGGISLGALLDDKGGCFGGFASGGDGGRPPAVPAEFVRLMSGAIGPLIAAAWRNLKLATLAETTQFWLSGVCEDALESAEWIVGAGDPAGDHLMPISDAEGRKLGSVVLKVKAGAQLNAFMEEMIKVGMPPPLASATDASSRSLACLLLLQSATHASSASSHASSLACLLPRMPPPSLASSRSNLSRMPSPRPGDRRAAAAGC